MFNGKINIFLNYLSLVKFSHTIFALPFALIGFFLGVQKSAGSLNFYLFIKVLLCMVFARNAAMAFNRYIDREIDLKNPRTALREIPKGIINPRSAFHFVAANISLFILTTWFINRLAFVLSPIALTVILGYSFTKKFTSLCHFVLGIGLALAPIGAYIAVTARFDLLPLMLSFLVLTWVAAFDIIYALQDEEFDKEHKLHSLPVLIGRTNALILSRILHSASAFIVLIIGFYLSYSFLYWIGAIIFICLLFYQHFLIGSGDLKRINLAFFTVNGIASVVYGIFYMMELFPFK